MPDCTCPNDRATIDSDPACPFHGDNGTMVVRLCGRCYTEGRGAVQYPCPRHADQAQEGGHDA